MEAARAALAAYERKGHEPGMAREEAAEAGRGALAAFERKGNEPGAASARALIEDVAAG